jgi:hypothetical protein
LEYINPAEMFLHEYGSIEDSNDLIQYVEFLRRESALDSNLPVDLARIYDRFSIPAPKRIQLTNEATPQTDEM